MLHLLLAISLVRLKADTTVTTAQSPEIVTDIRVQGNVLTPHAEMRQLAGVEIGAAFTGLARCGHRASENTRKFASIQVLKRFASIADPRRSSSSSCERGAGEARDVKTRRTDGRAPDRNLARKAAGFGVMCLPLLDFEDGYGFTYGVQFARPKVLGPNSRLSFPLTWGGQKQAGAQFEKLFTREPLTRVETGAAITERTNPFYEEDDTRDRLWVRAERAVGQPLRVGAFAAGKHVSFAGTTNRFTQAGVDDIRHSPRPFLARNAVCGRAAIEHLDFAEVTSTPGATRTEIDGRGYLGLYRQNILVLRVLRQDSNVPLPPYLQPLLGGMANLRGFKAGSFVGDTLLSGTAEIRAPLTSPLNIAKAGVSAFIDIGTVYDKGQRLSDQHSRAASAAASGSRPRSSASTSSSRTASARGQASTSGRRSF